MSTYNSTRILNSNGVPKNRTRFEANLAKRELNLDIHSINQRMDDRAAMAFMEPTTSMDLKAYTDMRIDKNGKQRTRTPDREVVPHIAAMKRAVQLDAVLPIFFRLRRPSSTSNGSSRGELLRLYKQHCIETYGDYQEFDKETANFVYDYLVKRQLLAKSWLTDTIYKDTQHRTGRKASTHVNGIPVFANGDGHYIGRTPKPGWNHNSKYLTTTEVEDGFHTCAVRPEYADLDYSVLIQLLEEEE